MFKNLTSGILIRFLAPLLLVVILGVGVVAYFTTSTTRSEVERIVREGNKNTAGLARFLTGNWLNGWNRELQVWSRDLSFKAALEQDTQAIQNVEWMMGARVSRAPHLIGGGLLTGRGEHILKTYQKDYSDGTLSALIDCLRSKKIEPLTFKENTYLQLCSSIITKSGQVGFVYVVLDLENFYENQLRPFATGTLGEIYILDYDGQPVLLPKSLKGLTKEELDQKLQVLRSLPPREAGEELYDAKDSDSLKSRVTMNDPDWVMVASADYDEMLGFSDNLVQWNIWGTMAVALLISLIIVLISRWQIREPLVKLKNSAVAIANGNLEYDIKTGGPLEISGLGVTLRIMRDAVKGQIQIIEDQRNSLDRKVKERTDELEKANQEIVDQAHAAGMAEIATGILHNIGNALVPLGGSLHLIQVANNDLPVEQLKAYYLLKTESHEDEDLKKISAQLETFRDEIKEYADGMADNLEHVTSILRAQQNFARSSSDIEDVDPYQLVEQAVKMQSYRMRTFHVELDFDRSIELPMLRTNRIKAVQVLVNVIKNAVDAMLDQDPKTRKLTIEVLMREGLLDITIADTGPGIQAHVLDRIFTHGFTTKADGHGFGLHSCANVMMSLNGEIAVRNSPLTGGAEFRVSFPLESSNQKQVS